MNVSTLHNSNLTAGSAMARAAAPAGRGDFNAALTSAGRDRQQVRDAAKQFVSTAFIMPLLAQARQDPFRSELFHGGQAEEMFGQQLDQHYADAMVNGMNFPLVDAIEKFVFAAAKKRQAAPEGQINING